MSDVNGLGNETFWKTPKTRNKSLIKSFHLLPCESLLKLHARRNFIAKTWGKADQKNMIYESPQQNG